MARETAKYTTKNGITYEAKTYLTAGELHTYQTAPQAAMTVKGRMSDDGKRVEPEFGDIDLPAMTMAHEYKLIDLGLVLLEGSADDMRKRALDLRQEDYNEILKTLTALVNVPT